MNTKEFRLLIVILLLTGGVWVTTLLYWMNIQPDPIIAKNPDNAACCSEEDLITIYEGDVDLKTVYDKAMEHVLKRDSVNSNAVMVIKMWEDSMAKKTTEPIKPQQ